MGKEAVVAYFKVLCRHLNVAEQNHEKSNFDFFPRPIFQTACYEYKVETSLLETHFTIVKVL